VITQPKGVQPQELVTPASGGGHRLLVRQCWAEACGAMTSITVAAKALLTAAVEYRATAIWPGIRLRRCENGSTPPVGRPAPWIPRGAVSGIPSPAGQSWPGLDCEEFKSMGHKAIAVTCRYAHLTPQRQLDAVRRLERWGRGT
jgi:hypothetical protein